MPWSDVVTVRGKAVVVTDAMFAPEPGAHLRAAANEAGVIAAVAQVGEAGTCQVADSLGHRWDSGIQAFGVSCVGINSLPDGWWDVAWMLPDGDGAFYARVTLDAELRPIITPYPRIACPFGKTSQGFLDLPASNHPIMTDQHLTQVLGGITIGRCMTRHPWTIGQDWSGGDRIIAWHAERQAMYEVSRISTPVASHLTIEADGTAVACPGLTTVLVREAQFVPWAPWQEPVPVPAPPPPPPPPPVTPPVTPPKPVPVPVPSPPVPAPAPVPPAPEPPASQPEPAPEPVPVPTPKGKRKPNIAKALRTLVNWLVKFGNVNHAKPDPKTMPDVVQVWPETVPPLAPDEQPLPGVPTPAVVQGQFVIETANPFATWTDAIGARMFPNAIPNRFFMAEIDVLWERDKGEAQRILDLYTAMGGTHILTGPVFANGYSRHYPDTRWLGRAPEYAEFLTWLYRNGIRPTLVVMTDTGPYYDDHAQMFHRDAIERDWTPFYRELRTLVPFPPRVVSQWEQFQDTDESGWLFDWMQREFPTEERVWHNPPNHLGPGLSTKGEAEAADHAVRHGIHAWAYQADPYGGGDGRSAFEQMKYDLWDLVRRANGYAGWPNGFKVYFAEGTAHPMYWRGETQTLARMWGHGALSVEGVAESWDGLP